MPKPPSGQSLLALKFKSAAIFAGNIRPRIEFPAPAFERDVTPNEPVEVTLEVIEGNSETVRERFLGVADPVHAMLVLPPDDFKRLRERVSSIADKPLRFELAVDEHGQLVVANIDGKEVRLPRHRSGVVGALDYDVDEEGVSAKKR